MCAVAISVQVSMIPMPGSLAHPAVPVWFAFVLHFAERVVRYPKATEVHPHTCRTDPLLLDRISDIRDVVSVPAVCDHSEVKSESWVSASTFGTTSGVACFVVQWLIRLIFTCSRRGRHARQVPARRGGGILVA